MNTAELTSFDAGPSASTWRDWLGITASIGCAIHCAAMPFVIAYLPAMGLSFLADEAFHKWMALVCFLIAIAAFIPGIRRHRNWVPISIGATGLAFITYAAFGLAGECCASCAAASVQPNSEASITLAAETTCADCADCEHCESAAKQESAGPAIIAEGTEKKGLLGMLAPWITPFGGVLLVVAHLLNKRYGSLCGCCDTQCTTKLVNA